MEMFNRSARFSNRFIFDGIVCIIISFLSLPILFRSSPYRVKRNSRLTIETREFLNTLLAWKC